MSMRKPPEPPQGSGQGEATRPVFKKVSNILALPLSSIRLTAKFCLCYTCLEMVVNDTILVSIQCPTCLASLPMMNFERFSDAMLESKRLWAKRRAESDATGQSGGVGPS